MTCDAIVQLEGLTHFYGTRLALDRVTFDVPRSCRFALLGPNGSGKTTLFQILATLVLPREGRAQVAGADVLTQRDAVRRQIGVVFQRPSLDGKLTVLENLRHQGHLYGLTGRTLRDRSASLLGRFGVADRAADRVETLSGGLKRRVELAKALLHRPKVLILDEPSSGLDPAARGELINYLQEARDQEGITTLLTTHLMEEADRCERIGILDTGRLIALDTPARLKRTIGGDVVSVRSHDPAALARNVRERFGIAARCVDGAVRIERERGYEFASSLIEAFPGEIDSVTVGTPTLDDVFVHWTGRRLRDGPIVSVQPRRRGHAQSQH